MASLYDATSLPLTVGRVPLLPLDVALGVYAAPDPIAAAGEVYSQSSLARQALASASPSLSRAVDAWLNDKPLRNPKTPLRAFAYLVRMSSRPTPYGLCAGVGEILIDESSTLTLEDRCFQSFTRPDMALMLRLGKKVEKLQRSRVKYVTNTCILERGGRLYVTNTLLTTRSFSADHEPMTRQRAVSLKNTEAAQFARELCREAKDYEAIKAELCAKFEAPAPQAAKLLDQLIQAGLLLSELQPSPLGDPVAYLQHRFVAIGGAVAPALTDALAAASALDAIPLELRDERDYLRIHDAFAALLEEPPANTLQTDLRASFSGTLARSVLDDATLLAELYVRCGPLTALSPLHRRFEQRYEGRERMVPLLELVDEEIGLGIPDEPEVADRSADRRNTLTAGLANDALRSLRGEIELGRDEIDTLFPVLAEHEPAPASLEIGFQIAAASLQNVANGEYLIVPSGFVASTGATKSIGRFARLFGSQFLDRARCVAQSTSDPKQITAELAYAPAEPRWYNMYIRPLLYEHAIFIGIGAPPQGEPVSAADLWTGLDDTGFFLWSQSRRRRVSIRETHAFATATNAPNLCRFLALLELEGARGIAGFPWGASARLRYLPRIRVGRIVLSPQRWSFPRSELGENAQTATRAIERWRADWHLPRFVLLSEFDHRLLIDLESPVAAALLRDQGRSDTLTFDEALPSPEQTWLRGRSGKYVVEFVAAARSRRPVAVSEQRPEPILLARRERHGPGSSWTYLRLYLGSQAMDSHLLSEIVPLVERLRDERLIVCWFFLRYADPDSHLRVRCRAKPGHESLVRERVLATAEGCLKSDGVHRYALDTYDPEYERYGGVESTGAAEQFFEFDSDQCVAILGSKPSSTDALVEAAVETFDAYLRSDAALEPIARKFSAVAVKYKLAPEDRAALRRLEARRTEIEPCPLSAAIADTLDEKRLADFLHLHCNRLGLQSKDEPRVMALVRALIRSRVARFIR